MAYSTNSSPGRRWQDELEELLKSLPHLDLRNVIHEQTPHMQAHGGFCDVFRATSKKDGTTVAVKRLRIHILSDENANASKILLKELRIWYSLSHPNVLQLLGYIMEDKYPSFISRWMAKGNLRNYMKVNPHLAKLTMAEGIAEGLKYLHEKGVIHSDLKADNVLISDFGTPLLADFGISRLVTATTSTVTSLGGSARWMAIELFNDSQESPPRHTKETDVWAYGMIVYELLTGNIPYYKSIRNEFRVPTAIARGQKPSIPPLLDENKVDDDLLWRICRKCWADSPADRPTMQFICDTFTFRMYALSKESGPQVRDAADQRLAKERLEIEQRLALENEKRLAKEIEQRLAVESEKRLAKERLEIEHWQRLAMEYKQRLTEERSSLETDRYLAASSLFPNDNGTTARISNIEYSTTVEELKVFFVSRGLRLDAHQKFILSDSWDETTRMTVVSFPDALTLKKAVVLTNEQRRLRRRILLINDQFDGFTSLSNPPDAKISVVALHGANGHAFNSWKSTKDDSSTFMWLRDYLPDMVPDAHIMVYGYDSDLLFKRHWKIRSFAEQFLEKLLRHIRHDDLGCDHDRPLILFGHSLGGIIVKQALVLAALRADKRFDRIFKSVRGVFFFGTPHRGFSNQFDLLVGQQLLSPDFMLDLTNDFRQVIEAKQLKVVTLRELKKTKLRDSYEAWIVDEHSATLGVAGERKVEVDTDHWCLCKFKDPKSGSLAEIIEIIKEIRGTPFTGVSSKTFKTQERVRKKDEDPRHPMTMEPRFRRFKSPVYASD